MIRYLKLTTLDNYINTFKFILLYFYFNEFEVIKKYFQKTSLTCKPRLNR